MRMTAPGCVPGWAGTWGGSRHHNVPKNHNPWPVIEMSEHILGEVARLLESTISMDDCIRAVVLSTREGVVVASVSRDDSVIPDVTATVSAALVWAGDAAMDKVTGGTPDCLVHTTETETVLIVVGRDFHIVVVLRRNCTSRLDIERLIPVARSAVSRAEMLMGSAEEFAREDLLSMLMASFPEVERAMLVTLDGLPVMAAGLADSVEVAGLAASIFANGLTYSIATRWVVVRAGAYSLLVIRVDEQRLLVAGTHANRPEELCQRIVDLLQSGLF